MSNSSTHPAEKSRMDTILRTQLLLLRVLENAGVRVIGAGAAPNRGSYMLFSGCLNEFLTWAKSRELKTQVEPVDTTGQLRWVIWTYYRGICLRSFISDTDKEAYDAAEEA